MAPEGWQETPVRKLVKDQTPGYWGSSLDDGETGTVVLRATNIRDDGFLDFSDVAYRDVPARKIEQKGLRPGDILLENSGGGPNKPVGRVAIFEETGRDEVLPTNFLRRLRPDPDRVHPRFLLYLLWHFHKVGGTKAFQHQTTGIRNLDYREYLAWEHPIPPLSEQRQVAAILSSVDDAIAATRKVIGQTKRVKKGLLQTLMTRGIGHIRFKPTEIGEIPEEWNVVRLEDVSERGSGHTPSKSFPEYWNGEIKWVSLADSQALDRVYLSETDKTITPEGIANSSAVLHPKGTVFVSRDASVGRSAIAACELAVSQHFIAWRCGEQLNNHFLYYFLQFHKPQFERFAVGSTIKTIGLGYFKRLEIPLPPLAEQEAIAESLLSHEQSVWRHEAVMSQLQRLKRGLLQDLLTGRVRVHPD